MPTAPRVRRSWSRAAANAVPVLPLVLVHLALFAIPFVAFDWWAVAASAAVLAVVGFGVTVGFHRYFAHKSFDTSRAFQFLLGFAGCASLQKGLLWWTVHHRLHHRHADREADPHSPLVDGFWYAHVGWLFSRDLRDYDLGLVKDLTRYPELVWLDRLWMLPGLLLAAVCYACLGWCGVVYGYCATVAIAFQVTFAINSVGHLWGTRRFETGEGSRNNWVLGLFALGEGWHNNHHRVPYSARHGFAWYEFDASYLLIRVLAAIGLVWNVKHPPAELLAGDVAQPAAAEFHPAAEPRSPEEIAPPPVEPAGATQRNRTSTDATQLTTNTTIPIP